MNQQPSGLAAAPSDADLARLLRDQPAIGLAALYDFYGQRVYSMVLRIVQDRGAAEEIIQDVFVNCWRNIGRYQPEKGSLTAWVVSIAHHRAIDELRSRRGKERRREQPGDLIEQASVDAGVDELVARGEIRNAMRELPDEQRTVIELIFWEGFTRREIAERLEIPIGTVHTRLRLGMQKLRRLLGHYQETE